MMLCNLCGQLRFPEVEPVCGFVVEIERSTDSRGLFPGVVFLQEGKLIAGR